LRALADIDPQYALPVDGEAQPSADEPAARPAAAAELSDEAGDPEDEPVNSAELDAGTPGLVAAGADADY
jgi:hypothetical protein